MQLEIRKAAGQSLSKRTITFEPEIRCPVPWGNVQILSEFRFKVCPFPQKVWTLHWVTWSRICKMKNDHNYNQRTRARLSVLIKQRQNKKETLGLEPTCLWLEVPSATTILAAKLIQPNFSGATLVYSLMAGCSWRFGKRPGSPYQNVP